MSSNCASDSEAERMADRNEKDGHWHCWHQFHGPIWMVIPDGHTVQKCCKCDAVRTVHVEHLHEHR